MVLKNFYHYTTNGVGAVGKQTATSGTRASSTTMTVKVKLWRYAGPKAESELTAADLEQVGAELVARNSNSTTNPTANWSGLELYNADGYKYTYYVSEDLSTTTGNPEHAADYVLGGVNTNQQAQNIVTIGGQKYAKITLRTDGGFMLKKDSLQ